MHDFLDLLDTSAAVYEANGDYAIGIFASGWCRVLDQASWALCNTDDLQHALTCETWHCHASCWNDAATAAITTGQPVDVGCAGGIRLYAVPVWSGGEIVGAVSFGYGDPPRDRSVLEDLAQKYGVDVEDLARYAAEYESRPPYIIELAKRRLLTSARLIGEIVERSEAQRRVNHLNNILRAIREVNQLIVREKDAAVLIRRACEILTRGKRFEAAWIVLTRPWNGSFLASQNGLASDVFETFVQCCQSGTLPSCLQRAHNDTAPLVTTDSRDDCDNCPLTSLFPEECVLTTRLEWAETCMGYLSVALPTRFGHDAEEQSLAEGIAADIGFALHGLDMAAARDRAEEQVRSLARFPAENPNPVLRISADGIVTYANDAASSLLADVLGAVPGNSMPPDWANTVRTVLDTARTREIRVTAGERLFLATLAPVPENGYVNLYCRDVSGEKRLADQLMQAQKMESVGRLAGGVAHDFNNLLMGIMNYVELCRDEIGPDHPVRQWLDEITSEAERSTALVRQLLAFARKQTIAPRFWTSIRPFQECSA